MAQKLHEQHSQSPPCTLGIVYTTAKIIQAIVWPTSSIAESTMHSDCVHRHTNTGQCLANNYKWHPGTTSASCTLRCWLQTINTRSLGDKHSGQKMFDVSRSFTALLLGSRNCNFARCHWFCWKQRAELLGDCGSTFVVLLRWLQVQVVTAS